jgi:hypothetical protein
MTISKDIADIIGISETNVATKINRIKKILKNNIVTINKLEIMDLDDLKGVWAQYDKRLSKYIKLNEKLLKSD